MCARLPAGLSWAMTTSTRPRHSTRVLARSPEHSRTLPSWIYRDEALLEREREAIFRRGWCFVGHGSDVRGGRTAEGRIDDCPVRLRLGEDGSVQGHRLDGASPRPIHTTVVSGLVFANLDDAASDLATLAPDFGASLRDFVPRIEELVLCHRSRHEVACNWKVLIENSLECYHCEPCHPGFSEDVDMATYRSQSDGVLTIHSGRYRGGDTPFRYWYLWPLTEIDASQGEKPRLSIYTREAIGAGRFAMIGHFYRLPSDLPDAREIAHMEGNDTLLEDYAICESVQRGLASRGYGRGRFIVDPERSHISEHSVHHFQLLLADALDLA